MGFQHMSLSDPKEMGIRSLADGSVFRALDSYHKQDASITGQDMESMLAAHGVASFAPWAHFVFDAAYGDYRRYIKVVDGHREYDNAHLMRIILDADADGDGAVSQDELCNKLWNQEWDSKGISCR